MSEEGPIQEEVGLNDIEITIHVKETMMAFPPVEDLIIEMVPTMPSMGHGSYKRTYYFFHKY